MKIVIDISKDIYKHILKAKSVPEILGIDIVNIMNAVKNGTPLPKGHGDLIDRDEFHQTLENMYIRDNDKWFNWLQKACLRLAEAPTIIEADKEESEV